MSSPWCRRLALPCLCACVPASRTPPGPLVVLERLEGSKAVLVSRKPSLVAAARAGTLPCSLTEVQQVGAGGDARRA